MKCNDKLNDSTVQRMVRRDFALSGLLLVVVASLASPTTAFNPCSLLKSPQGPRGGSSSFCHHSGHPGPSGLKYQGWNLAPGQYGGETHRPSRLRVSLSCRMSSSEGVDPSDIPRKELQTMAKQFGVRANMKSAEIVEELSKLGAFEIGSESRPVNEPTSEGTGPNEKEGTDEQDLGVAEVLSEEAIAQVVAQVDGLGRIEVEEREFEVPCALANFGRFRALSGELCWAEPATAAEALVNVESVNGKLVLVRRGGCSFVAKALRVQEAGGAALVLVNNEAGAGMFRPGDPNGEDRGSVQIPVVMVSMEDGDLLGGGGVGDLSVMDLDLLRQDFEIVAEKETRNTGTGKTSRDARAGAPEGSTARRQESKTQRTEKTSWNARVGAPEGTGARKQENKTQRPPGKATTGKTENAARSKRVESPAEEAKERPANARNKMAERALEGVKLKDMVEFLRKDPGFEEMFLRTGIRVFGHEPSVKSALKFLRAPGSEWARRKVEGMYLEAQRRRR